MKTLFRAAFVFAVASLAISTAQAQQLCAPSELNAPCTADVLWRDARASQVYFMNPLVLGSRAYVDTPGDQAWQVAGIADASGDAKPDILWRNPATGVSYLQLMNGLEVIEQAWKVVGIGDFDGDGKPDILWRNTATGVNYIYFMNGLELASHGQVDTLADQAWKVAGIGDFDGDGKADILWRNTASGANYIYLMNGLTIASRGQLNTVADQGWKVVGSGDFNGDGKADILWHYPATGMNYLYFMNGLTIASQGNLNAEYAGSDVGAPAFSGWTNVVTAGSAYDITAAGRDVYATSDQFHFAYKTQSGDFDLRVRVSSLTAVNVWSKAGLMARESMAPDSRELSVFATPAAGYEFQYRATTGAFVQKVDSVARVSYPNTWVRLKRAGNEFSSYTSVDGSNWTQLGKTTMALPATVFVGMAVTSHHETKAVVAKFRDLMAGAPAPSAPSPDTSAPSVPGGLAAVAVSPSQINLSWSASTDNVGVTGYRVLRSGVQVATTSALAYDDTGLSPSTIYTYTVAAVDAAGNVSGQSTAASANTLAPPDLTAPSVPAGLTASAVSSAQINLSWSASSDNVGVKGYNVLRGGVLVAGTSALTYADTGLSPSTTYTYTVTATDAAGNLSAPSTAASATTLQSASGNSTSPLGTNLASVKDWSREWTFIDAFRASRLWISGSSTAWDDGRALATDADGWVTSLLPGQIARTLMFWDLGGYYPAGTYVVLYDGEGSIEYGTAATLVSAQPGRAVLQVDPARGGITLFITATNPANYLRNIRVIMPGGICESDPFRYAADAAACADAAAFRSFEANYGTIVFHPKFLERIRTYRVLRFMDWSETNNSTQSAWSGRPKPSDARWTAKGVPVEVMVDLANRIGADPWFTLPHLADDNYVTEYARLVNQQLRSGLKAYVEYSNEVWNGMFSQAGYAQSQGLALGLSTNAFQAQLFFYSRRSVEVFNIWGTEIGDPARLVRVMGSQAANSWASEQLLDFQNAKQKTDALAIAPYFGGYLGDSSEVTRVTAMSLTQLFTELETVALPQAIGWINAQAAAVTNSRGVPLIAYEGGQHLVGYFGVENNAAINALFDGANRDPRMGTLYKSYLDAWKASGARLFVHFQNCAGYSKWGRWGALEYLEQPRANSPKFNALQSFIEQNPAAW